ncbi:MAG: hypothetical protein L6Q92_15640 [Phycisphaerae bacterium]|nr:hypothetical protein [Phycisphaerae bacterium]
MVCCNSGSLTRTWIRFAIVGAALLIPVAHASALIDLVLVPSNTVSTLGCDDIIEVDLVARSDDTSTQLFTGVDVILNWDTVAFEFLGEQNCFPPGGAMCPWISDGFFPDADGLNNNLDDGDAFYTAFGQLGMPAQAPPQGMVVTTLRFRARAVTAGSTLSTPATAGMFAMTAVVGDDGSDVTGDISSTTNSIVVENCSCELGDVDLNTLIEAADLAAAVDVLLGINTNPQAIAGVDADCDNDADGDDLQPFLNFMFVWLGL